MEMFSCKVGNRCKIMILFITVLVSSEMLQMSILTNVSQRSKNFYS